MISYKFWINKIFITKVSLPKCRLVIIILFFILLILLITVIHINII